MAVSGERSGSPSALISLTNSENARTALTYEAVSKLTPGSREIIVTRKGKKEVGRFKIVEGLRIGLGGRGRWVTSVGKGALR